MYNRVLQRLYREFKRESKTEKGGTKTINFLNCKGEIVATLFPNTQVLNIFLSASENVVWNHWNTAIFVLAKSWNEMTNKHIRKAEASWLIGLCGAPRKLNLIYSMFLDTAGDELNISDDDNLTGYATLSEVFPTKKENEVKFKIFDYEITYCFSSQPYSNIRYFNPALIYPIKHRGKIDTKKTAKRYLRKCYDWEYNQGFRTAGSAETREFISKVAPKNNHTELSTIKYFRTF